jgi:hypothetical protein
MAKKQGEIFDTVARVDALTEWARDNLSFERAIRAFAIARVRGDIFEAQLEKAHAQLDRALGMAGQLPQAINAQAVLMRESIDALRVEREQSAGLLDAVIPEALRTGIGLGLQSSKAKASRRGQVAAAALHDKPGGSRSKADAVRAAWATGNFESRDICAEQECAALGMSFSAARKALRNTPDPA